MFFLQDAPANTVNYMIAGYAVIFGVMLIYLISQYVRRRNLKADFEVVREIDKESPGQSEIIIESIPDIRSSFSSNYPLTQWLVILLLLILVVDIFAFVISSWRQVISVISMGLTIITGLIFFFWLFRTYKNLQSFGVRQLMFSPGWAVGGFFFPFINLIHPLFVVTEIWKASDPDSLEDAVWQKARSSTIVTIWGILFPVSFLVSTLSIVLSQSIMEEISIILSAGGALLAILMIRKINRRLEEKAKLIIQSVPLG